MRKQRLDEDLPILEFFYVQVVEELERQPTAKPRKVPRKEALEMFLANRSWAKTAAHYQVSPTVINGIVYDACRIALRLARIHPAPLGEHEGDE